MAENLPYNIDTSKTKEFFTQLDLLSDQVYHRANEVLGRTILDENPEHTADINESERKKLILEFLIIGILWRGHIYYAYKASSFRAKISSILQKTLPGSTSEKNLSQAAIQSFLERKTSSQLKVKYETSLIQSLIDWLQSLEEYNYELPVIEKWKNQWAGMSNEEFNLKMLILLSFTEWFCTISNSMLGEYFNDEYFRNADIIKLSRKNKADVFQVLKPKEEYFLNLIGAVWMNEINNKSFQLSESKVLFSPGCMRLKQGDNCQAKSDDGFLKCASCNKECNVYKLQQKGKEENFEVRIILHQSSMLKNKIESYRNSGVVGIACVSCLLSGGLMLWQKNIDAKCLFLTSPGCSNHWLDYGKMTNISQNQLSQIIANPPQSN